MKNTLRLVLICFFISACIKTDLQFVATDQLQAFINVSNNNNQKPLLLLILNTPNTAILSLLKANSCWHKWQANKNH